MSQGQSSRSSWEDLGQPSNWSRQTGQPRSHHHRRGRGGGRFPPSGPRPPPQDSGILWNEGNTAPNSEAGENVPVETSSPETVSSGPPQQQPSIPPSQQRPTVQTVPIFNLTPPPSQSSAPGSSAQTSQVTGPGQNHLGFSNLYPTGIHGLEGAAASAGAPYVGWTPPTSGVAPGHQLLRV